MAILVTQLSGGNTVQTYQDAPQNGGVIHAQIYNSQGVTIGPEVRLGGNGGELSGAQGYLVTALSNGGYAVVGNGGHAPSGPFWFGDAVSADASQVASIGGAGAVNYLVGAAGGGFATAAIVGGSALFQNPPDNAQPIVDAFDNSGARTSGDILLASQITAVSAASDGGVAVNWDDGGTTRTLSLAPNVQSAISTPPTPTVAALDDQGGQIAWNATTTDTTPTIRVSVTEAGEAFVQFGHSAAYLNSGGGVPVTQADVSRGYIDIPESAAAGADYWAFVRVTDSSGSASQTAQLHFTVGSQTGQTLQGEPGGSNLQGGSGDDTLIGGNGPDTMTGAGGADHFAFKAVPWSAGHITDFNHGVDKLDLSTLLSKAGYSGADPIADGYVKLIDDGQGDSWLYFDSDGRGSADPWGSFIATLDHVAPSGVTSADLVGAAASPPPPPPPPPSGGQTLHGQAGGSNLMGGSGDDTLIGGTGPDTMTGGGGADHFVWSQLPWSAGQVTDFTLGVDRIDLSALLAGVHYAGADPIADGYVKLIDDGHGDTWLYFDTDGRATADQWGTFVATLNGVRPGSLSAGDFIFH